MTTYPILSIITVNLNNRDGLKRTIDSVVCQTFTDYEWIVIDGGSTDGSRELIEQYQNHFAYWCSEPDKGIYNAMNKGIVHAKGEWLQFLNSGDLLFKDNILQQIFSNQYYADVIYGDAIRYSPHNTIPWHVTKNISLSFLMNYSICHQSSFFNKRVFINRFYDDSYKLASDWALYLQLVLENAHFQYVPYYITFFENEGLTHSNGSLSSSEREQIKEKYIPYHIKDDINCLLDYKERERIINSHKTYRIIMKNAERCIKIAERIITVLERLKAHK